MDKYALYEASVQSPETHLDMFCSMYQEAYGEEPRHLREDFCGTFRLSSEWVKRHPENKAVGLDLDPEPLGYGKKKHWSRLNSDQKKRLEVVQADVLRPIHRKSQLVIACNFSFFIFKDRKTLLAYFKNCLRSLSKNGALILEAAGGPGMIAPMREQKKVKGARGNPFTYIWHQRSFDPISHDARYSIHFKFPNGKTLKDAFVYDWRLWTLPELRELLAEAGFKRVYVYWETSHRGEGTGEYARAETADNDYAWIAYLFACVT